MARRITVFDTTLRDGEHSPGVVLQPQEKGAIAAQLERLGVDVIEAGFPISSPGDFEAVREVACTVSATTVAALARTRRDDVDAAAEALAGSPRSRVHVIAPTIAARMEQRLCLEPDEVVEQTRWAVAYATTRCDEVQFSAQDATRSDPAFLARLCREAVSAGATTVGLPDTSGSFLPEELCAFLGDLRARCPELDRVTLSVHCHDNLGLAVANSLAGVAAGAGQVECTVGGVGERGGNAALEEVATALRLRPDEYGVETDIVSTELGRTSSLVSRLTGNRANGNDAGQQSAFTDLREEVVAR